MPAPALAGPSHGDQARMAGDRLSTSMAMTMASTAMVLQTVCGWCNWASGDRVSTMRRHGRSVDGVQGIGYAVSAIDARPNTASDSAPTVVCLSRGRW